MKKVTVYSTPSCPYCIAAKDLLTKLEVPFESVDLSQDQELRTSLSQKYNWMSVPMIVIGDEFIGGFDDMKKLHQSNELLPKINA